MTPEETASFLDQYVPKQPTAELAPVQPGVEQTTVSPQTTTAPQDNISNFLDQYEQPQTPRPADVPAELTPAEKFMSPSQQELMTHKTKPIGPNFWEVRPEKALVIWPLCQVMPWILLIGLYIKWVLPLKRLLAVLI
jgi:hypothetical protein